MSKKKREATAAARRRVIATALGPIGPDTRLDPATRSELAERFDVTAAQIRADEKHILEGTAEPPGLVVLPKAVEPPSFALMDDEARQLMRTAAIRLLRCAAAVDDYGTPYQLDPKTSKDAAQALAVLLDKVPDILSLRSNLEDEAATATLPLGTAGGDTGLLDALKALPPSYLKQAMGD